MICKNNSSDIYNFTLDSFYFARHSLKFDGGNIFFLQPVYEIRGS
jgi:hypothetical protein